MPAFNYKQDTSQAGTGLYGITSSFIKRNGGGPSTDGRNTA
jgi:hypothetical protein